MKASSIHILSTANRHHMTHFLSLLSDSQLLAENATYQKRLDDQNYSNGHSIIPLYFYNELEATKAAIKKRGL